MAEHAAPVTVVVPTYNERPNLTTLVERVLALGPRYRLLVVDDGSPDGTGDLADALAAAHPDHIAVIHRARKEGIGPAYRAGFQRALAEGAPLIAQMDADLSHDPVDLPRLVAAAEAADLAIGSRYAPGGATVGWSLWRRWLSAAGCRYARMVLGLDIADLTGGFKVWRRETLAALDLDSIAADGYGFQIETTTRAVWDGAHAVEVPICFHERVAGASKLSRRIVVEAALLVWRLRVSAARTRHRPN
ncbi:MAG: polyprenol monophosphomannose synthase [Thermomicrobiales bacterium]|nr:polyprenol monophosphomannose synthase [Thermomicrobiales bacterium]